MTQCHINESFFANKTATPLSEDIGILCAGVAAAADVMDERGALIEVADQASLESLLSQYGTEYLGEDIDVAQQA
jgi:hypothetical protein